MGQPNFRAKYYNDEFNTSEMVGYKFTFEFDVANYLFWEDEKSPVTIGAGISGRDVLRVNKGDKKKWIDMEFWRNNPENMDNIRYWLYMIAKPYPDINSIYVDDRYLILILDKYDFYNYREIVAKGLDK